MTLAIAAAGGVWVVAFVVAVWGLLRDPEEPPKRSLAARLGRSGSITRGQK